jgi:hypothetical protein
MREFQFTHEFPSPPGATDVTRSDILRRCVLLTLPVESVFRVVTVRSHVTTDFALWTAPDHASAYRKSPSSFSRRPFENFGLITVLPFWMQNSSSSHTNPVPQPSRSHQLFVTCSVTTPQGRPQLQRTMALRYWKPEKLLKTEVCTQTKHFFTSTVPGVKLQAYPHTTV